MRAYYGLKADIVKHMEMSVNEQDEMYWDDRNHRLDEDLNELSILNVSTIIRANLD